MKTALEEINEFLLCETPESWLKAAINNQEILLIDHANCEKKAASSAMQLVHKYSNNFDLIHKMSRLVREEMRHFEQVTAIMKRRKIAYSNVSASRYASELRKFVRKGDSKQLVDILIIGAFIEARSCERFSKIAPLLDAELCGFYTKLLKSEGRHYQDYLKLARDVAGNDDIESRINLIAEAEKKLINDYDPEFRFHSGCPIKKSEK
tara:strand:- start:1491 stop:2114 length:624 start_codon:yes stop_codon:yes gene_type:complete